MQPSSPPAPAPTSRPLRVVSIGGGPAGLYAGILLKLQDPRHDVLILERNRPGETFGWGVVFSKATLGGLAAADPVSYAEIERSFAWWDDIDVYVHEARIRSTGHGFCGMARKRLLEILATRARELGCVIRHDDDVSTDRLGSDPEILQADVVLAADGVNSAIRTRWAETFKPSIDNRRCKFTWLGTTLRYEAFTFLFRENEHGLFQVHAYPFDDTTSTFIVECREETWRSAGLDSADEAATVAYMETLFAADLGGHRLLSNKSIWRTFPTIRNASWRRDNMVLMGDACHTAHFSIGSGTKLAMEDAITLVEELGRRGDRPMGEVLDAYEALRRPEVERLQASAQTSLEWFENTGRYMRQDPEQFVFSLLSRSKRITWDELQKRDPALVRRTAEWWAARHGTSPDAPPIFTPLQVRGVTLPNRIVVSPMCQYSAVDGLVGDWHLVHLGSRAIGGAGLVLAEATAVSAAGRITPGCAGLYQPEHVPAWERIVRFVHERSASKIGIQLAHAGRKASSHVPWEHAGAPLPDGEAWTVVAPSPIAYDEEETPVPHALTLDEITGIIQDFARAAGWARDAGFDWLELHCAHGYLLNTFLSALSNHRTDAYGGSLEGRLRLPLEVLDAVRAVWPDDRPISVRISATEWTRDGLTDADRVVIARALAAHGADLVDCSAGGVVPWQKPVYGRMFQVPFADQIRHEAGVPTMAVGNIQDADQCNTILASGRADLCLLARGHLADPYFTLHAAERYGHDDQPWPPQYLAAKPRRRKGS